jgi:LPS-assembly protein
MKILIPILATLCLTLWGNIAVGEEDQATLVADEVTVDGDGNLIATGDVEIYFRGESLTAPKVVYDATNDRIDIEGPLLYIDKDGNEMEGVSANMTRDLQNGLVKSAKFLIETQMELEATSVTRQDGRMSTFKDVVATSCVPCKGSIPVWHIRAKQVRYDNDEKQIYYKHAQFRLFNFPIFYTPYLRTPHPSLKRFRGFLVPSYRITSQLGTGILIPYFIPIGESRDITLTPYISPKTNTLRVRYRQAFNTGNITFEGAVSQDKLGDYGLRSHGVLTGAFTLPKKYELSFRAERVSDSSYHGDYFDAPTSIVTSNISIRKTENKTHQEAILYNYHSLYDSNSVTPTVLSYNRIEHKFDKKFLGGTVRAIGEAQGSYRKSYDDVAGRDTGRLNSAVLWSDQRTGPMGLRWGYDTQLRYDIFFTGQDSNYDEVTSAATADAMIHLRWPWMTKTANTQHIIEPILQLGYSVRDDKDIPNEESLRVELDQGNLFSLSRFPAPDRYENGARGAVGLRWEMRHTKGYALGVSAGRVFRDAENTDFSVSSGLREEQSDLLLAVSAKTPFGFSMMGRGLFGVDGKTTKAEILTAYSKNRFKFNLGYSHLNADSQESRNEDIQEYTFDSTLKLYQDWTIRNSFRYDLIANQVATAGLGMEYDAQCFNVDVSATRRFTENGTSPPQTTYQLKIELKGFKLNGKTSRINTSCRS